MLLLNTQIFGYKLVRVDMNIIKSPVFRTPLYYVVVRYLHVDTVSKEWFPTLRHSIPIISLKLYPYHNIHCHSATAILYFYNIKVEIAEK